MLTFQEYLIKNESDLGQKFGQSIGAGIGGALGGGIGAVPGAIAGRALGWVGDKVLGKGSANQIQPLAAQAATAVNNLNNAVANSNNPKLKDFVAKIKKYSDQLANSKVISRIDQQAVQQVQQDRQSKGGIMNWLRNKYDGASKLATKHPWLTNIAAAGAGMAAGAGTGAYMNRNSGSIPSRSGVLDSSETSPDAHKYLGNSDDQTPQHVKNGAALMRDRWKNSMDQHNDYIANHPELEQPWVQQPDGSHTRSYSYTRSGSDHPAAQAARDGMKNMNVLDRLRSKRGY